MEVVAQLVHGAADVLGDALGRAFPEDEQGDHLALVGRRVEALAVDDA